MQIITRVKELQQVKEAVSGFEFEVSSYRLKTKT
jgi:hypothetical protein